MKDEINNLKFEDIATTKVGSVSEPTVLARYYVFKAHLDYYVSNEHLEQFDVYGYFIYDNYSNIKY